jgi:hypothetical protein
MAEEPFIYHKLRSLRDVHTSLYSLAMGVLKIESCNYTSRAIRIDE